MKRSTFWLYGFNFLMQRDCSEGFSVYVKHDAPADGESQKIGAKRTERAAMGFAMGWAEIEKMRKKRGWPSQLVAPRRPRPVLDEEE